MKPGDKIALASYLYSNAGKYRLDPRAVYAVATQEGLGGGIGDNGTSFGPWQLHQGGAYPSNAPAGGAAANDWAWSPVGINYALSRMGTVAGGQKGAQAVHSIVYGFERPANPAAEYQGALAQYKSDALDNALLSKPAAGAPGIAQAAGGAVSAASGAASALGSIGSALGDLTSASFWLRAVEVVGGGAMIFVGVYMLARQAGIAPSPSSAARAGVAVAAPEAAAAEGVAAGV